MPENEPTSNAIPRATVTRHKRMRLSVVWIVPVLAAVLALGIAVQRVVSEGPLITISFQSGDGIEAGKTLLKYKDVTIGQVTAVHFADDFKRVIVKARIAKSAAGLMVEDTKFWVVAPHISITGISGIGTLLSGNYIGVMAGKSDHTSREFLGLDEQPRITGQAGQRFTLTAKQLGSLSIGAPLYFRQLPVGEVESYELAKDGESVTVSVFVRSPYDAQVRTESRFWNASGVDVTVGESGLDVHTASLLALLAGGVEFETPEFGRTSEPAAAGTTFRVYADRATAMKQPQAKARRFVLYFSEPVKGLAAGAPVTLMGLTVGEVTDVGLSFDERTLAVHPRVVIAFYPELAASRFSMQQRESVRLNAGAEGERLVRLLRKLVEERGLRAQLRTSSLLTGQQYVAFDFLPKATKTYVDWSKDPLELPVAPGALAELEAKLGSILTKIDQMPLPEIGTQVSTVLKTLNASLADADVLLKDVDIQAVPEFKKALVDLHKTLDNANATMLGVDAPNQQALHEALQEVARSARSLRALTDYLERHPEALIRGKSVEKP